MNIVCDRDVTEIRPHHRWREHCERAGLRFFLVPFNSPRFDDIVQVRAAVYGGGAAAQTDEIDSYSEHYLCVRAGRPVSAMRSTRAIRGPLECHEFMPQRLFNHFSDKLSSGTRFVAIRDAQGSDSIAQLMMEAALIDQLARGARIDVINVHERAVRYYGRFGYELIHESFFVHPRWRTPSRVMLLTATPRCITPLRPIFADIDDPCELESLTEVVMLTPWKEFRHETGRKGDQ